MPSSSNGIRAPVYGTGYGGSSPSEGGMNSISLQGGDVTEAWRSPKPLAEVQILPVLSFAEYSIVARVPLATAIAGATPASALSLRSKCFWQHAGLPIPRYGFNSRRPLSNDALG